MQNKLFGTDGIRGRSNDHPMTPEIAFRLGEALVQQLKTVDGITTPKIVVGKDTRLSGYLFESSFTAGICAMGGHVYLTGPLPTPGIAKLISDLQMDAGVIISASHNPYHDNGIKIFSKHGFKLSDESERGLEELISKNNMHTERARDAEIGYAFRVDDASERYIASVRATFPKHLSLKGMRIAIDAAHGAAYRVGPAILSELGATVTVIGANPTGTNINDQVGSLHPEHCAAEVLRTQAALGIALDGDADRVVLIDEHGKTVDGDAIMAICAMHMLDQDRLHQRTLVATVMSNLGLEQALQKRGANLIRAGVGDRYVLEEMLKNKCNFGGESSGHLIFLDHSTTGDGMVGALQVLAVMAQTGKQLSELSAQAMQRVPQILLNINFSRRVPLEELPKTQSLIQSMEKKLGSGGRVFVRWSGTESKLRIMLEGTDQKAIEAMAQEIAASARGEITP